ncbi:hypothetical protein Hdeb2414_s0002g00071461 [Helianthus debilis subsp. tardiflorus]
MENGTCSCYNKKLSIGYCFLELEPVYTEYWNSNSAPKSWSVGPLCLAQERIKKESLSDQKPSW